VRIREFEKLTNKYVYIIALTANAFPEDVKRCIDAGMDHFLSKPIKERELLSVIDETMNK
ncbi:MAG: response regulator, partial [Spirochaetales bacterium]|nr:response regulator [Spirochaetales bacterium]